MAGSREGTGTPNTQSLPSVSPRLREVGNRNDRTPCPTSLCSLRVSEHPPRPDPGLFLRAQLQMFTIGMCPGICLQLTSVPMAGCTPKPNRLEWVVLKFLFVSMGLGDESGRDKDGWGGVARRVRVRVRLSEGEEELVKAGEGLGGGGAGGWVGVGVNQRAP